jgi:hypothetical protein
MVVDIQPIEIDGKYYVNVIIDGSEMDPRGPFSDAAAAESAAERLSRAARALRTQVEWRQQSWVTS